MLTVRENQAGIRYLTSVNEKGEEHRENIAADFEALRKECGYELPQLPKTDRVFAPGKYDPKALESFERKILNKDEVKELAAELAKKYDPTNMTGAQFDSFMDDLVKEGVLSENELGALGYHGTVAVGSLENGNINSMGGSTRVDTGNPYWETYIRRYGHGNRTFEETKGNALDYVRLTLIWSKDPQGGEQFVKRIQTQNDAFRQMERILAAM